MPKLGQRRTVLDVAERYWATRRWLTKKRLRLHLSPARFIVSFPLTLRRRRSSHTVFTAAADVLRSTRGMIDRRNRVLRGYRLSVRGFMEAHSQVGGDSRSALSRS